MGLNGERFDAVLVGAGIIGSSAAMGLAERGLKVAVLDVWGASAF
ncbi:MAG: NAD(P)-binding protein [Candidatus Binataceae bacterium]